jgi:hypothetical protein
MKSSILTFICLSGFALAQDKPRVFIQGKGSQDVTTSAGRWSSRSTIDSHDESMEVAKDLQKNCAGVIVTVSQSNADYTVLLNRESKHNRGLLRTNSQIQVANRLGDMLGANATRTVGNASKNACQLILADWSQHGKMPSSEPPASAPGAAPVSTATASVPAVSIRTVSAVQSTPTAVATGASAIRTDDGDKSSGDAGINESLARIGEAVVEISSDPPGADIEIDGGFVGSSPSSVGIAAGEHTLRVSKAGYKQWERTLKSSTGNIKIAAALEAISVAPAAIAPAEARDARPFPSNEAPLPAAGMASQGDSSSNTAAPPTIRGPRPGRGSPDGPLEENLMGVSLAGNPNVRHDGVEISRVQSKGPADTIEIKSGDVILAINAHYLFTIDELRAELRRYQSGSRVLIRYRRNQFISENYLTLR